QSRRLVERYLQVEGKQLIPYRDRPGTYHFVDPLTDRRLTKVIFDAHHGLDHEDCVLLSLGHPYMIRLIDLLDEILADDVTAKLLVKEKRFAGEKGYLVIYRLTLANYIDRLREYIIPCFVGIDGVVRGRISRWFAAVEDLEAEELVAGTPPCDVLSLCSQAEAMAEQQAEEIFYELSASITREVEELEQKMQKFYRDKEESIRRVAVDNIRKAKMRGMQKERAEKQRELSRRRLLVPSLERLQIAYVEFEHDATLV
ncbi:MAG: hypothetical protein GX878_09365, partial [Firmicutes bacterium]|nr:hypothetical protein [Bacillota bacterium]